MKGTNGMNVNLLLALIELTCCRMKKIFQLEEEIILSKKKKLNKITKTLRNKIMVVKILQIFKKKKADINISQGMLIEETQDNKLPVRIMNKRKKMIVEDGISLINKKLKQKD